ncbi:unnamed protein product [Bathycoccus prasinos]
MMMMPNDEKNNAYSSSKIVQVVLADKRDQPCTHEDELRTFGLLLSSFSSSSSDEDDDDDKRAAKRRRKEEDKETEDLNMDDEERKRSVIRLKFDEYNSQADGFVGRFCEEKEEEQQFEGEGVKERVHVLGDALVARCLRRMFHGEKDGEESEFITEEDVLDADFEKSEVWSAIVARKSNGRSIDDGDESESRVRCVVVSALESFESRAKIDRLCKKFKVVLVDVGIEDDRGSVFVVDSTQNTTSYECLPRDLDESKREGAVVVLENFPFQFSHCVEWSRHVFERVFVKEAKDHYEEELRRAEEEGGERVYDEGFVEADSANRANRLFVELFQTKIDAIRESFPRDKDDGKFWGDEKGKRFPEPVSNFKTEMKRVHTEFLLAAQTLYKLNYHNDRPTWDYSLRRFESLNGKARWDHAIFVETCALLRARTYRIDVPKYTYETHRDVLFDLPRKNPVAGFAAAKIASREIKKILLNEEKERRSQNSFFNVVTNDFVASECPSAFVETTTNRSRNLPDLQWTIWSVIDIDCFLPGKNTLGDFLQTFREQVGLEPASVGVGAALVYMEFMSKEKRAMREKMSVVDAIRDTLNSSASLSKEAFEPIKRKNGEEEYVVLTVQAVDEKDEDKGIPDVIVRVK